MTMKKLLSSCTHHSLWKFSGISSVVRAQLLYSTKIIASSSPEDTLYSRITPLMNPRASVVPILDRWIREGRGVEQEELQKIIRQLRKYRRFDHALEVSQWMSDKRYFDLLPGDIAVRLDLISKVRGLEQAEQYFNNVSNSSKTFKVYGALLNCYAHAQSMEKAEATMHKMRNLGYVSNLSYSVMMNMYSKMGKHEKLDSLMEELEEKGVTWNKFACYIRLNAYVTTSDIEGMERLVMKMEANPLLTMDWSVYTLAANGYFKTGARIKALTALKKAEQLITADTRFGYGHILTLYAKLGKKDDVYRVWNSCKNSWKTYNTTYASMINSLVKLDDLEGAKEILEEWEAQQTSFDFRIPNILISAYCTKVNLAEAESIVNRLIETGKEPTASTWDLLAFGYCKDNQMAKAVENLKKAILAGHFKWKPNYGTLGACLDYLVGKGDVKLAKEVISLYRKGGHLSSHMYNNLVDGLNNGSSVSKVLDQMGKDDQDMEGGILEDIMKLKFENST